MNFLKGALIGMVAGTVIGVMNSNSIMLNVIKGKRKVMKFRRRHSI